MNFHACLSDPQRYDRQIERLHQKYLFTRRLYELQQSDVSLASFVLNRSAVTRKLARTVGSGAYRLQPAQIRTITTDGKQRIVFAYRLTDLLVHGVVAGILEAAVAPRLSPSLYSYRKGVSWWTAIAAFAAYVRLQRKNEPEVRRRGLYVIRRDIDSYTDSIPVGPTSPVWNMLRSLVRTLDGGNSLAPADWHLLETVVRPEAFVTPGQLFTQYRGVPTGQPISCVLFNLYLSGLDAQLDRVPGAFYARYCDDLVFAHPDPDIVRAADVCIRETLSALAIELNESKSRNLYLTGAGRQQSAWPDARGATEVPLLGCRVSARGAVSLSRKKRRRFLADIEDRAFGTARALRTRDPAVAGRTICAVINRALEPKLEFSQQRSATLLRRAVTDREDLKHLDYCIARIVLRAITGQRGAQAFRTIPYRTLREEWRLTSLLQARNKWPKRRASELCRAT
ncbi:MAG TPA: reverse transcriptase domain-containing protein [Candidatus Margulisiibacteriota bacterium]|nr:reverse transcriptase domain-containing protein [Candidatus Margulisiibacteriota bacterium]